MATNETGVYVVDATKFDTLWISSDDEPDKKRFNLSCALPGTKGLTVYKHTKPKHPTMEFQFKPPLKDGCTVNDRSRIEVTRLNGTRRPVPGDRVIGHRDAPAKGRGEHGC